MSANQTRPTGPTYRQTGRQTGQVAPQQVSAAPEGPATSHIVATDNDSASRGSDSPDNDGGGGCDAWSKSVLMMQIRA